MTITGEEIKKARKLLGWSRFDLGLRASVSDSMIGAYEAGKRVPTEMIAEDLRRALDTGRLLRPRGVLETKEAKIPITGAQVMAARALLGWSLLDLGYRARVSEPTVAAFEQTLRTVRPTRVEAMKRALEAAGIKFIAEHGGGAGVRLEGRES
jgi:transcriptional regulator with XRE-family HTH domain